MTGFNRRRRCFVLLALAATFALVGAVTIYRPDRAIRVGTAVVSQTLCSEVFVAGLDPERVFREEIEPQGGMHLLLRRLQHVVDMPARRVTTTWAGHFASVASYRDDRGCTLGDDKSLRPTAQALSVTDEDEAPVVSGTPALQAALAHAFAEPTQPPYRRVRAIVVMRDGRIVAERYAPGIDTNTPLLAYSVSKSVINALIGILVRENRLDVFARAPVAAWSDPSDPRRAITLDNLLRMTSGLRLDETDSGFDPVSRMLFTERDMAAYAERAGLKAVPGRIWEYTSGNTLIVSSILRDRVGGRAEDVLRFAHRELFDPLGMRHVTMEFDAAGTPIGSTRMYASARDWAKFGQLYLDDGVVNGRRLLPQGWVAYSTRPTLDSDYGAGFWVNAGRAPHARGRTSAGMPVDTFFASGNNGQRIMVIPSQRLVIVRFGATIDPPDFDIEGLIHLINEVIAAG